MKLTRSMIKAFAYVVQGENTLTKLANALHKSIYWTDIVLNSLEKEGFIAKKKDYTMRGNRLVIEVAQTQHALKLKEVLFTYSGISFEDILANSRLLFLASISEDWMTVKTAIELSGISKHIIDKFRPQLKNRGIIVKKKDVYTINEKAWPLLKEFLIVYKNYSMIEGHIRWKYNEEMLFEVNNERLIQNNATGLYAYKNYGVKVSVVSALCFLPKKKLSKEEVFVHSLFEIKDPRTLHLALTFYIKNKLAYKKVALLAMKYGKYSMFGNFIKLLKTKEERVKFTNLPKFELSDFTRIANIYGVKNV
ncbi:MAG: hypothetical protein AABW75_02090 [Nanoarchaeota archaeon]